MAGALLEIQGLRTSFHTDEGVVRAVDDVSFALAEGETLGVVGESGSGKSVTSLSVARLLPKGTAHVHPDSRIVFLGRDLLSLSSAEMTEVRGRDVAMIFQEPMTSLNPVFRVGEQVLEAIVRHHGVTRREARQRAIALFREVGIPDPETRIDSYPHEMSGGQKQRVMIAMALSCNPRLLIADEPTTALDVTIQAQILDLLRDLRDRRGMSILFITHDLGVIAEIADRVAVMYRGRIVEYGDVLSVFSDPRHPYTKGLLACRPRLDTPYRLLPTVDDFLETWEEAGEIRTSEKVLTPERLAALVEGGRPKMPVGEGEPLLKVRGLKVHFPLGRGRVVKAVDGVDLDVWRGQTLGLVGESGCGKTTTGRAILGLVPTTAGTVTFDGEDLGFLAGKADLAAAGRGAARTRLVSALALGAIVAFVVAVAGFAKDAMLTGLVASLLSVALVGVSAAAAGRLDPREVIVRRKLQIVFQDPYSSLNPRLTVEQTITEPMKVHGIGTDEADRRRRAGDLLAEVGLERSHLSRYPHEFSGGQRQRICIARTLALEPSLVVCDESVSALDVSVQAQVLNLLKDLQVRRGLTYIFISHDLSVVKFMSDVMCVMQDGRIVEAGPSEEIYAAPREDYTRNLIAAIPRDDVEHIRARQAQREAAASARG